MGHGRSADGAVTAEVAAGGAIKDLWTDPRAMRLPSESLRDSVLEAIKAANEHLAEVLLEFQTGTVDIAGLLNKVELPPEMTKIMDDFNRRAGDIDYNMSVLRRKLDRQSP